LQKKRDRHSALRRKPGTSSPPARRRRSRGRHRNAPPPRRARVTSAIEKLPTASQATRGETPHPGSNSHYGSEGGGRPSPWPPRFHGHADFSSLRFDSSSYTDVEVDKPAQLFMLSLVDSGMSNII